MGPTDGFVPWLDDALLPEESSYSVVCKAAWFTGHTPASFLAQCRTPDGEQQTAVRNLHFQNVCWPDELSNLRVQPWVHGKALVEHLVERARFDAALLIDPWSSPWLRVCPKCIRQGIHLSLHQHLAVERCPVHRILLRCTCAGCGNLIAHAITARQRPFACGGCHCPMLREDRIAVKHHAVFRGAVQQATEDLGQWVRASGLNRFTAYGPPHLRAHPELRLQACTAPRLLLEACCRASTPPEWIRRISPTGVSLARRRFDGVESERVAPRGNMAGDAAGINSDRYHASLRRVTSMFLRRWRPSHPQCLDTPVRIQARYLYSADADEEIMRCCPVAVGFWLWRLTASQNSNRLPWLAHANLHPADLDRILFGAARSHLHYCIYAAHSMCLGAEKTRREGDHTLLESIICQSQWTSEFDFFATINARRRASNGSLGYLNVAADELIRSINCPGAKPYLLSLCSTMIPVRKVRRWMVQHGPEWKLWAYEQQIPFLPMKRDGIFLDQAARCVFDKVSTKSNLPSANKHFRIVDSAINSKAQGNVRATCADQTSS